MIDRNLVTLRKLHHMTQEELAEQVGVSRQAVAKWETGATTPDLENSIALAEFYGVTLDNLVKFDAKKSGIPIPPKGKHFFGIVAVGDRGQIVIPKKARDIFNIRPGDSLAVLGDEDQGIAILKSEFLLSLANEIMSKRGKDG